MNMMFSDLAHRLVGQEMFHVLDKAGVIERSGGKVYHLELGDPHLPPDPVISECIQNSLNNHQHHYVPSSGSLEYKNAICNLIKITQNIDLESKNIIAATANYLITNFLSITCNPSETVLVITPCFPSYLASAKMLNINVHEFPTTPDNGYIPNETLFDTIEQVKPKAIIVNSANNPTGAVYSKDFLLKLIDVAKKNNCWILSDETYSLIVYGDNFYSLLNSDYEKIVVLSSLSKSFSIAGYRMGYHVSKSDEFNSHSNKFLSTNISCSPSFIQLGCATYLNKNELVVKTVKDTNDHYKLICDELFSTNSWLKNNLKQPKASFYLFIPVNKNGNEFALNLINNDHVAVTPGKAFGKHFESYVRATICGPKSDVIEGIKILTSKL